MAEATEEQEKPHGSVKVPETPEEKAAAAALSKKGILAYSIVFSSVAVLMAATLIVGCNYKGESKNITTIGGVLTGAFYNANDVLVPNGGSFLCELEEGASYFTLTGISITSPEVTKVALPYSTSSTSVSSASASGKAISAVKAATKGTNIFTFSNGAKSEQITAIYAERYYLSIGDYAFSGLKGLSQVEISTYVGTGTSPVNLSIGAFSFAEDTALSQVLFPGGLLSLGEGSFSGCLALQNADLSTSSLTTLGSIAKSYSSTTVGPFENCTSLAKLALPKTLLSIGDNALLGCPLLTSISYANTSAQWSNAINFSSTWHEATLTQVVCSDTTLPL